jgi:5-formyltetrahydrofolate cyclo-ligase
MFTSAHRIACTFARLAPVNRAIIKKSLVVVPALAVAATGHRLGYGGGFYDAMLPDFCPPAIAVVVAFDFQLVAELPAEPHDVQCGVIVTDARTLRVEST